ncbi:MAG: hypothetical protein HY885_06470 [Deltaproteobacteria bacterium]|nr:hypothetical protein [Deltaproteobacteria bacterium]
MSRFTMQIVLVITALFLIVKTYSVWTVSDSEDISPPPAAKGSPQQQVKQFSRKTPGPKATYELVVKQNILSEERKEFIPQAKEAEPEMKAHEPEPEVQNVKIGDQEITLYGILYLDDFKSALINNPLKSEEDKRQNRWVKIGDKLANMEVDDIQKDKVILHDKDKNQKFVILLRDEAKAKKAAQEKEEEGPKGHTVPADKKETKPTVYSTSPSSKAAGKQEKKAEEGDYTIVETPFGPVKQLKTTK